ncbi:MAG: hypothetical protein WBQ24_14290 [Xanthobacteraceae bacterium]
MLVIALVIRLQVYTLNPPGLAFGGLFISAGNSGGTEPSGKSGTGTMPRSSPLPGCAGSAVPSTGTTGTKPGC